jgi:TatD DNase family protein
MTIDPCDRLAGLIDTHCHLSFDQLAGDVPGVLDRAAAAGVEGMITIGTTVDDSAWCVALAGEYANVWSAVGVHPHEAKIATDDMAGQLEQLAGQPKVVAIGETGLDYHYEFSPRDVQQRVFASQLEVAARVGLPVVVHCRDAFADALAILDGQGGLPAVVFHCFAGTVDEARTVLDRGWMISLTGIVTFGSAGDLREVARLVPDDRLMVETDSPYLSPVPVRSVRPNEPWHVCYIARFLAALRGASAEALAAMTTANARRVFRLDGSAEMT